MQPPSCVDGFNRWRQWLEKHFLLETTAVSNAISCDFCRLALTMIMILSTSKENARQRKQDNLAVSRGHNGDKGHIASGCHAILMEEPRTEHNLVQIIEVVVVDGR